MAEEVGVWFDPEADYLEVLFDRKEGYFRWGADWIPHTQEVRYEALINIHPRQSNPSMDILDADIRRRVGAIAERLLGAS